MEYGLIFTIYGLIFNIMLLMAVLIKRIKKTPRTKVFILLIVFSMIFSIAEIVSIYYYKNTHDFYGYASIWKLRNVMIICYIYMFVVYFNLLVKGETYNTLTYTILKTPLFLTLLILLSGVAIYYMIFSEIGFMRVDSIKYIKGAFAFVLVTLAVWAAVMSAYTAIKIRKQNKKIALCLLIIVILFICLMPVQIIYAHISFMPFLAMFLMYVIYHNIENPDIELLEDLTMLQNQIEKSNNAKTNLLFNLSYDLINPINAIVSLSQSLVIMPVEKKDEIIRDLKSIKYAGNTLLDSIDNIFDLSESDEQENVITLKEYSIYELLKRIETVAIARIGAKPITYETEISDNISSKMIGDINKIQKILMNVINNAVKYSEIGKIKLTLTANSIDKENHVLHFKISDTGMGIKDDDKEFVFTDSIETSGVGLAITKRYVESMNGTIKFESVYGAGTTFYIDIPQKTVGTRLMSDDMNRNIQKEAIDYIDCSKYKVAIVDDDNLDIKITKRLVEKYKFKVTTITSALECINRIKQEEEFDILFLDHKMSEMDGIETLRILKKLDDYKIPKIIALTANAASGSREFYLNAGFDDYISKPIDIYELDKIIKNNIPKE